MIRGHLGRSFLCGDVPKDITCFQKQDERSEAQAERGPKVRSFFVLFPFATTHLGHIVGVQSKT
jgi:hypothetical protein